MDQDKYTKDEASDAWAPRLLRWRDGFWSGGTTESRSGPAGIMGDPRWLWLGGLRAWGGMTAGSRLVFGRHQAS